MKSAEIIKQVIAEHEITADEFFSLSRDGDLMKARMKAAERLKAAEFTVTQIAKHLRRSRATISYYLYPKSRATRKARKAREFGAAAALRILSPDVREVLLAYAVAEQVKPEIALAQWAADRAQHEAQARRAA